ncbi:MAG: 4-alpha-glucanotransferase, partial [Sphaerochaetaceae bacterium]|nr:4-alpha-glucanotransferase [Sphaerochaetaceae bacterium]
CKYMKSDREHIASNCIKALLNSKAKFVIIPMQDYLHKTNECRMNTPGTLNDSNWTYKMENFDEFSQQIESIKDLNIKSHR